MQTNQIFPFLFLAIFLQISCTNQKALGPVSFLVGKWQVEGKDSYEEWRQNSDYLLTGSAYKIKDGQKFVSETLKIQTLYGDLIYSATVPDQNAGQTIAFVLNKNNQDVVSFENSRHDFPKKIQYKLVDKRSIFVQVKGDQNDGFSYYLKRKE